MSSLRLSLTASSPHCFYPLPKVARRLDAAKAGALLLGGLGHAALS
jgi:hypothetical protein